MRALTVLAVLAAISRNISMRGPLILFLAALAIFGWMDVARAEKLTTVTGYTLIYDVYPGDGSVASSCTARTAPI